MSDGRLAPFQDALDTCAACPQLCTGACPTVDLVRSQAVSPWGLMQIAREVQAGRLPTNAENARHFYHCLACGKCEAACPFGNPVVDTLDAARAHAVDAAVVPREVAEAWHRYQRFNNEYGINLLEVLRACLPSDLPHDPETVWFPGVSVLAQRPALVSMFFQICERLGIDDVGASPGPDTCTGYVLWRLGFRDMFERHARRVARFLEPFRLVVAGASEAVYTLRELYPRVGVRHVPQVIHVTEFLARGLEHRGHGIPVPGRYAYFGEGLPTLDRMHGDGPARVLRRVMAEEPVSLAALHPATHAGDGAPLVIAHPTWAKAVSARAARRLEETNPDFLVVADPRAHGRLEKATKLPVLNVVELVARFLGLYPDVWR